MKLGFEHKIDRSTIMLLVAGVTMVVFIAIFLIIPGINEYGRMTGEIPSLQNQLEELRELKALSLNLDKKVMDLRNAIPEYARSMDTAKDITSGQVIGHIEKIAIESNVRMRDNQSGIWIDPATGGGQRLRLSSVFLGTLDNLRIFLLKLLQQPYILEFIDMTIESGDNGLMLKLHFVVEIS